METQERVEREISLVDLMWNILLSWRRLICLGIIFAVLVGVMRYFLDVRAYNASKNIDYEEMEDSLEKEELEKLSNAITLQGRINNFEDYLKSSAIMQIDPYAKPVLELQYYIQSDYIINFTRDNERDYTSEIVSMYCNYLNSGELAEAVINELSLPITKEDFGELVSAAMRSTDSSSIYLSISYAEEGKLDKISDVVQNLMEKKSSEFQEIGIHKLQLVDESQSVKVDANLAERKNTVSNNIMTLKTQLGTLKATMSEEQKQLFDIKAYELWGTELEELEEPVFRIKYMILGAAFGIFLVCAWVACKLIFASKLQFAKEIRNIYGVRLFGEAESLEPKKKFLSGIDRWILNLRNRGKKAQTVTQQIKSISMNIALSCRQQGVDSIYITGSEYNKADKVFLDNLKKELSTQKIRTKDGGSVLNEPESLQAGVETGHIVLVEQKQISTYKNIYMELELLREYQSDILGVIVL